MPAPARKIWSGKKTLTGLQGGDPRPFADRVGPLVWHPPGERTVIHGLDLNGSFYVQDVPQWNAHPFTVNVRLPVDREYPVDPLTDPDYRRMSASHRGFYLFWLKFRQASVVPLHSRLAYIETWLQGLEWRLLIEGAYDRLLLQQLEVVLLTNRPHLSGTKLEHSMLDLLCYTTFCHDTDEFSALWRRLAATGLFTFASLSRQLILTDLFHKGEPLRVDLAPLIIDLPVLEWRAAAPDFREAFNKRYPDGKTLRPSQGTPSVRYHSSYTEFEAQAERKCGRLRLPSFDGLIESVRGDFIICALLMCARRQAAEEAAAKAAAAAKLEARLKAAAAISPPVRPHPSLVDLQLLKAVAEETLEVRGMLTPLLAVADEADNATSEDFASSDPIPEWAAGLAPCFVPAMVEVCTRTEWSKAEFEQICSKHQVTRLALQDAANAWADDKLGDFIFEGDDPIRVQQHLLQPKTSS